MRRHWRSIVLALCCSLALAASASAECAWVLWSYTFDTRSGYEDYNIDSAHATRTECGGAVERAAAVLKGKGYNVAGAFPGSYEAIGEKGTTTRRYYCLPDTVDPRGPKGSRSMVQRDSLPLAQPVIAQS